MKLLLALLGFFSILTVYLPEAQSAIPSQDVMQKQILAQASRTSSQSLVRVRLMTLPQQVQVSGFSLRFQNLEMPYRNVATADSGGVQIRLLQKNGKKLWALRLKNSDREHLFTQKFLMVQGENLHVAGQSLPSKVLLSANGTKNVDVVGVMPIDEYIVGVLASEMPLTWPMETLKAQAVAARSYTLSVMEERKDKAFHLESTVLDQVFRHVLEEKDADPNIAKAVQAVRETQGVNLYGPDHKVLKAFYHADCGGKTTTAKNVWSNGVNVGVATDSSCPTNPKAQWSLQIDKQELARRMKMDFTKLTMIPEPGGERIQEVRVALNDGDEEKISANEFRQMIGFQDLRSTLFKVQTDGHTFSFVGRGFGHGVGLCQWGSRAMGAKGRNFREILKHYYPLASLR